MPTVWQEVAYRRGLQRETGPSLCPQEAPVQPIVKATATEASAQTPSRPGEGLTILSQRGPRRLPGGSDI